jgi:hypothetical protein
VPSRIGAGEEGQVARLRPGPHLAVVVVGVVDVVVVAVARVGLPPRVGLLELHVGEEDEAIEELVVDQTEAVDVDPGVVLLVPVDEGDVVLDPGNRRVVFGELEEIAVTP